MFSLLLKIRVYAKIGAARAGVLFQPTNLAFLELPTDEEHCQEGKEIG